MLLFSKSKKLKILFISSEAAPFVKVGGLGEVMHSLPKSLRSLGHDARVMTAKYASVNLEKYPLKMELQGFHPVSPDHDPYGLFVSNVLSYNNEKGQTEAYFLENKEYYEKRANIYGYSDDAVRWALLSKGTLEFIKQSNWHPDIIVACDWQTGLISNYLKVNYKNDPVLSKIASLYSIHNLFYQGNFDHHLVNEMDYDAGQAEIPDFDDPRLLKINFMRRGIMYADAINTVSPTYAQEITTSEYGELLDGLLAERKSRLFGILNGMDYDAYNPETDSHIENKFNAKTLFLREKNKTALRRVFNLPDEQKNIPIYCIVSRLTDQKGFGLLFNTIRPLLNNFNFQLVILGSGDNNYVTFFSDLVKEYPDKVAGHFSFDGDLPHIILAGADVILIPSKFEPSGLTQMEAMRYGVIPLVRKTGGLADSVIDHDPQNKKGNGFVFEAFDDYAFYGAVVRTLETFKYPKIWEQIQARAMKADFSWTMSAKEYIKLFENVLRFHNKSIE